MDFRILGPLEVSDGERSVELRGPKVRALLAMLVLHANEAVSTDRLVGALWPDHPPDTAANTLQTYVSQLRKALGSRGQDLVVTRPPGYLLAVPPQQIDLVRFERLVCDGRAALAAGDPSEAADRFAEALDLWRGEPLADFAFESFAQSSAVRLSELRLAAVEEHVEADLALGRRRGRDPGRPRRRSPVRGPSERRRRLLSYLRECCGGGGALSPPRWDAAGH